MCLFVSIHKFNLPTKIFLFKYAYVPLPYYATISPNNSLLLFVVVCKCSTTIISWLAKRYHASQSEFLLHLLYVSSDILNFILYNTIQYNTKIHETSLMKRQASQRGMHQKDHTEQEHSLMSYIRGCIHACIHVCRHYISSSHFTCFVFHTFAFQVLSLYHY